MLCERDSKHVSRRRWYTFWIRNRMDCRWKYIKLWSRQRQKRKNRWISSTFYDNFIRLYLSLRKRRVIYSYSELDFSSFSFFCAAGWLCAVSFDSWGKRERFFIAKKISMLRYFPCMYHFVYSRWQRAKKSYSGRKQTFVFFLFYRAFPSYRCIKILCRERRRVCLNCVHMLAFCDQ